MATVLGQDPLSLPATVLPTGPSALDIGYKRMAMEQDADKLAAQQKMAADKIKQKQAEQNAKAWDLKPETVFLTHTDQWLRMGEEQDKWVADQMYNAKRSGNPDDDPENPRGRAGRERMTRERALAQWASNSNQVGKMYADASNAVDADPTKFKPGTKEKLTEWASNMSTMDNNKLYDPLIGMYDTDKDLREAFGAIDPSQTAWATPDGTASGTHEFILPEETKAVAEEKAGHPYIKLDLEERFALLPEERQKQVEADAKANGLSIPAMMAFNLGNAWKVYDKRTSISEQQSESGFGARADERGSLWLGKYLEDVMSGDFKTTTKIAQPGGGFGFGETVEIDPTTLIGWTWDQKDVYDEKAKSNIKKVTEIKDFIIDRDSKEFIVSVGPVGGGKARTEVIPFDQAESKLVPRVAGLNKEKIRAIGGYDISAEKTGEGTRKEAGASNIVKTPGTSFNAPKSGGGGMSFNVPRN